MLSWCHYVVMSRCYGGLVLCCPAAVPLSWYCAIAVCRHGDMRVCCDGVVMSVCCCVMVV